MSPRTGQCACRNTTFGIIDQNGNPYDNRNSSGIWTVPNFGPHPELQLALDNCSELNDGNPFELIPDTEVPNRFTLRWCATQQGNNLVAADGETVLFTVPAETPFKLNGATQATGPVTAGGLTVTPNGPHGHCPTVVLAIDTDDPPPFSVNGEGVIVGNDEVTQSCFRFWPDEVTLDALEADPAAFQIGGQRTFVCVIDGERGQQSTFIVQNDAQGNPQEHQVA